VLQFRISARSIAGSGFLFGGSSDGLTFIKPITGNNPDNCAGCHSDESNRIRVRYDWGTDNCGQCLSVLARDGGKGFWEGGAYGFDKWARDSASRAYANPQDQPNQNINNGLPNSWNCNDSSVPPSPAGQGVRRWEFTTSADAQGSFFWATTLLHGWEGGRGAYDCEPLSRAFGPPGTSYSVNLQYSIDAGWSTANGAQPADSGQ
jgi:hypothetical protein